MCVCVCFPCWWGLQYGDCTHCKGRGPLKKSYPRHDTKLYLIWRSGKCEVFHHWHYSYVSSARRSDTC